MRHNEQRNSKFYPPVHWPGLALPVQHSQGKYLKHSKEKEHPVFSLTFFIHTLLSYTQMLQVVESGINGHHSRTPPPRCPFPILCQVINQQLLQRMNSWFLRLDLFGGPLFHYFAFG